jgi:hypothetical protein
MATESEQAGECGGTVGRNSLPLASAFFDAPYCPWCGCQIADHTFPEEVEDGIPWALLGNGEDPLIITCGDCNGCAADPREWKIIHADA